MTRIIKILIATSALTILSASLTCAQTWNSNGQSTVLNGQVDLNPSTSTVNTQIKNVSGTASSTSSAGGNNLEVVTMDNANVTSNQYTQTGTISATDNASVLNAGSVDLAAQATCNAADVSTDPHTTAVTQSQECDAVDPTATLNASVTNVGNGATLAAQSIGNSFSEDSNATQMPITTNQYNSSAINATVNAKVTNVLGNVSVNSTAMGNTAQIVQY